MTFTSAGRQSFLVLVQDPGMMGDLGERIFAEVDVSAERLALGPTGYRVKVVDYDAEAGVLYRAHPFAQAEDGRVIDPFVSRLPAPGDPKRTQAERELLAGPAFHSQNVYALVMRTLGSASTRSVAGFPGDLVGISCMSHRMLSSMPTRSIRGKTAA